MVLPNDSDKKQQRQGRPSIGPKAKVKPTYSLDLDIHELVKVEARRTFGGNSSKMVETALLEYFSRRGRGTNTEQMA